MLFSDHLPAFLPQLTGCWVPKPNCKAESLRSDHSYHRHKVCANSPARRQVLGNQPKKTSHQRPSHDYLNILLTKSGSVEAAEGGSPDHSRWKLTQTNQDTHQKGDHIVPVEESHLNSRPAKSQKKDKIWKNRVNHGEPKRNDPQQPLRSYNTFPRSQHEHSFILANKGLPMDHMYLDLDSYPEFTKSPVAVKERVYI